MEQTKITDTFLSWGDSKQLNMTFNMLFGMSALLMFQ